MDEPATDEPATDEPVTDEPAADEPATDEPAAHDTMITQTEVTEGTEIFTNSTLDLSSELMQSNLDDTIPTQRCESDEASGIVEHHSLGNYPENATEPSESPTHLSQVQTIADPNGNISGNEKPEQRTEIIASSEDEDYSCVTYICDTANDDEFILNQISSLHNSSGYSLISIRSGVHPDQRKHGISPRIFTK